MTGFLLRGAQRPSSRSRRRQKRRRRNPSSFVASCPTLLPFAYVTGASPTTLTFPPAVLQRVPFVLPSPQVASLPLGAVDWCGDAIQVRGWPLA
uniref:Uncharacterized protein n=1 Tax=Gorilla gorilla gorilla TaxID=9595 RepID=A0A2I2ZLY4_GORGO